MVFKPHMMAVSDPVASIESDHSVFSGSLIISGGLGDIGQLAGHWAAGSHPSCHVWLLGRTGRAAQSMAAALAQHSGCVSTVAGDVAAASDMARLVLVLGTSGAPAVSGLLHAGAVLHDALLGQQTAGSLRAVFAPKVTGALRLLDATSAMPLQAVAQFSSLTAQLGTPGQANYAAANAALEAVAQDRLNQGLQSRSVMWGPWASGLALNDARILERFKKAGLGVITGTYHEAPSPWLRSRVIARLEHDPCSAGRSSSVVSGRLQALSAWRCSRECSAAAPIQPL